MRHYSYVDKPGRQRQNQMLSVHAAALISHITQIEAKIHKPTLYHVRKLSTLSFQSLNSQTSTIGLQQFLAPPSVAAVLCQTGTGQNWDTSEPTPAISRT